MLPAQRNKADIASMTEEEKKLFQLYGKLPAKKSNPLARMQERKYFDSGDYAMSKAGKSSESNVTVGTAIPKPDSIPHASPPPLGSHGSSPSLSSSPIKESTMSLASAMSNNRTSPSPSSNRLTSSTGA